MLKKKTVEKILEDEDNIDIAKTAEAILSRNHHDSKKKPTEHGRSSSIKAYQQHLLRKYEDKETREALSKAMKNLKK